MLDYQQEENNYPKAFLATGTIVAIMAVLCYIIVFTNPPPPEMGTGGILVNYGTTNEGMGNDITSVEEPSKAEHPNHTRPSKVTPAPATEQKTKVDQSDKKVVTQNTEDAPEVNSSKKPTTKAVSTEPPAKPAKPTLNQNALYKGKTNGATGEGDGTTNTPGNQGSPNGSNLSTNYNGTGSGNGGLKMPNRHFMSETTVANPKHLSGIVVVDIRADKNGNIIYARAGGKGTTISDGDLWAACEKAALQDKVNASDNAPDVQLGTKIYNFKLQ